MRLASLLIVLALPAIAAPNPSLTKASKLFDELNYVEAQKAIDAALRQPGNERETLLKIFELQAIVLATLNQGPKATLVFSQLLTLEPDFALTGNHPPRVSTAFFEARGWAASNGRLEFRPLDALLEPGSVKAVRVEVTKDPAKLVRKVRFHISGAQVVSLVVGGVASAAPKVPAREVTWWAQLLGDKDAVLADVGSQTWSKSEVAPAAPEKPAPVAKVVPPKPDDAPVIAPPPPEPAPLVAPPLVKAQPAGKPIPPARLAVFGLIGGAAVFAGVGVGLGVMANGTRAQVDNAPTNSLGQVTSMTHRQAFELDATQRFQATAANVFFVSAAALAIGGGVLFYATNTGGKVAIVPLGPGAALVGTLP